MKRHIMVMLLFLCMIALCFADGSELVLVDTLFVEPSPMSGSIYFNMQDGQYSYYPQMHSLEIGYARSPWGNPGIQEFRAFVSFQSQAIPSEYHIDSVALHLYCEYYVDCSNDLIWPNYYGTAYPVRVDHVQYETIAPAVFDQTPLEVCVAILQDSAYIG